MWNPAWLTLILPEVNVEGGHHPQREDPEPLLAGSTATAGTANRE
jgi:hypothetical protein